MKAKNKIIFRLYQIDKYLPTELIEGYLSLETTDDIMPEIYRLVWESPEEPDLDALYNKYSQDDRPNNYVCRSISVSDVVEIEDEHGISKFFICDKFGWLVIPEFEKGKVPFEMGFEKWYLNLDNERRRALSMEIKTKAVIQIMVQKLGKSSKTVTSMFRNSKTYEDLHDEKTGLWAESPYLTVNTLEKELADKV